MAKEQSLQKAMDYIEENLTKDISYYDIAREAGISVPHFYRLFKRLTGDTVGAYILRRRISMAANDLVDRNKSIVSIAFEYGFESHDVFTRAFRRVYGMSPSKYRKSITSVPLKRLTAISDQSVMDEHQMKFSLLQTEGLVVAGLECRAVQWDSDGAVGKLWSEFLARLEKIQLIQDKVTMYGICEQETCNNENFTYMAAIGIDAGTDIPSGMTKKFISPQNFFQASVPDCISTPDAYAGAIGYARSLGYALKDNDIIEVYDGIFQNPDVNRFRLLIPII
ncbi:AraC family transcriptional regulator [Lacrimispora sp.]|uniref:AraC family transcriptional regulator n=1 Tax=Lacrimispora sp. TaxID=2719234 RepID=UPI0032E39EB2